MDFFVDKKHLTDKQLEDRFSYRNDRYLFYKEKLTAAEQAAWEQDNTILPTLPPTDNNESQMQDFAKRIGQSRDLLKDLAVPRLHETFLVRARGFNKKYKECRILQDYFDLYRSATSDNDLRFFIFSISHSLWTKDAITAIEKKIMGILKLEYHNYLIDEVDHTPKTRRGNGSIAKMINRLKQSLIVERLRHIGLASHKEVIYLRCLQKTENMDGVIHVEKVCRADWGFDGYLGFGVGHPYLLTIQAQPITMKKSAPVEKSDDPSQDMASFMEELRNGGDATAAKYLETWEEKRRTVTVSEGSPDSVSTLTTAIASDTTVSS